MRRRILILMALFTLTAPLCLSQAGTEPSLGELARQLRREKEEKDKNNPDRDVIDNENFDQLMKQMQSQRFNSNSLLFSLDGQGKGFKVSSPDVSCNLSFSGKAASLLMDPFAVRSIPNSEIPKLDGPAVIQGNTLQISVFNGSDWNIKELIVGLTFLRTPPPADYGPIMLRPASESVVELTQKRPDHTVIYHLRGSAAPQSTTVFSAELTVEPPADEEWHWAIVGAKGTPTDPPATSVPANDRAVPPAEPVPAISSGNPHP